MVDLAARFSAPSTLLCRANVRWRHSESNVGCLTVCATITFSSAPQTRRRFQEPCPCKTRTLRCGGASGRSCPSPSIDPLQSGIDSLGRAVQLASDVWDLHSGIQHFPELALLRFCPASSSGSWSSHFPFAFIPRSARGNDILSLRAL